MYQKKEWKEKEKNPNTITVSDQIKQNTNEQSGFPFTDVKIHYKSNAPSHLQTLACRQKNAFQSPGIIQMAQATIKEIEDGSGTVHNTTGPVVNHESYPNHAEQKVWAMCSNHLISKLRYGHSEDITFIVDTPICPDCRLWFENTVWKNLNDTGGNFKLSVEVADNIVEITGINNTIWPNEITDSPTWDRLREYDKMHRFVTEGRNPATGQNHGKLINLIYLGHQQMTALDEQMQYHGDNERFKTLVEHSLATAKDNIVHHLFPIYDFPDEDAMYSEITSITLLTIMNEAPTLAIPNIIDCNSKWENWNQQLTCTFEWWLEYWIDTHLEEHKIKKENPHY